MAKTPTHRRPPDEGSAADKIKAILKYEPDCVFSIQDREPRKRPKPLMGLDDR